MAALLIVLASIGQTVEQGSTGAFSATLRGPAGCLTNDSRTGDVGKIATHMVTVRAEGPFEESATVREILGPDSALLVNYYGISTSKLGTFTFVLRGMDTTGWTKAVRKLPGQFKVTGWHKLPNGREVQILEQVKKP